MKKNGEQNQFNQLLTALNRNLTAIAGAQGNGKDGAKRMPLYQAPLEPKWDKFGKRIPPPLAPLPNHLLPKALGGENDGEESDESVLEEGLEDENKKEKYSVYKKLKNKKEKKEEAIQHGEDARFLNDLFADNIS